MFLTAFDRIEKLFSREFLIAYFFPWLIFFALNLFVFEQADLGTFSPTDWFLGLETARQTLFGGVAMVCLVIVAYVFTPLVLPFRLLLEGRYLPSTIQMVLRRIQRDDRWAYRHKINSLRIEIGELDDLERRLQALLTLARARGRKTAETFNRAAFRQARRDVYSLWDERELVGVTRRHVRPAIASALRAIWNGPYPLPPQAEDLLVKLADTLEYLRHRVDQEYRTRFNSRDAKYPRDDLAPTAMGNRAEAIRSYVYTRHGLDISFFWQRLQLVQRDDATLMAQLHEAKTRLDFFVLLFWLTVLFTLAWTATLGFLSASLPLFLAVGVAGPMLALLIHQVALASYEILGDLTRSAIDLHRIDLLKALGQEPPADSMAERQLWELLQGAYAYGDGNQIHYQWGK